MSEKKTRISQIAKENDMTSKEAITILESIGIMDKKPQSGLLESEVFSFLEKLEEMQNSSKKEEVKQEPVKPVEKQAKNEDKKIENPEIKKEEPKVVEPVVEQPEAVKPVEKTNKKKKFQEEEEEEEDFIVAKVTKNLTVKDLADAIQKSTTETIMILMKRGVMASINQQIDFELASSIAEENDIILEEFDTKDLLDEFFDDSDFDDAGNLVERPPVVVVMGHVDHGKTSLLDRIRKSNVTKGEAGGITQHIGAYTVRANDKKITFLDTPGHEAFTAMRMRGASVTDIAILVVAADDGVMPQTIEAIAHAKAAEVEIIVAINKIDKPGANLERVKKELAENELLVEEWGGSTVAIEVSAHTGEGIPELLDMILLTTEMQELKANPKRAARGAVIEARLDKGRGSVASVLVQNGTLKVGDPIVAGTAYGRIRAMIDDKGKKVKKAGPSIPVEILGLSEVPKAGDSFYIAANDREARRLAESMKAKTREELIRDTPQKVSLDDLFNQIQLGTVKELNVVIKADVQGSVEAMRNSILKLSDENVRVRIVHGGVGAITETDVMLASTSNAIIIGFNVKADAKAQSVADTEKVDLRHYTVIYNAINDISIALKGLLDPIYEKKVIGHAEIRQIFKASGVGTIAGSYVLDGKITRGCKVVITRAGKEVYEGDLQTLKRFKDDVKEVAHGYECGLLFNKFNEVEELDIVEAYIMEEVKR